RRPRLLLRRRAIHSRDGGNDEACAAEDAKIMTTSGNGRDDDRDDGPDSPESEPRGVAGVDVQPMPALDREQVEALRKERDDLRDQLLRRRADFENYPQRGAR